VGTLAAPVLQEHDLPATVFLVTDRVGTEEELWPDRAYLLGAGSDDVERLKTTPRREKDAEVAAWERERAGEIAAAAAAPFRLMDWDAVAGLARTGRLAFGAHSLTHEILSRCEDAEVRRQVIESQRAVTARLGRAPRVFAYPNGRAQDFDDRARRAVEEAGIPWALSTIEGLVGKDADDLALPRVGVGADLSFARFRLLLAGMC